MKKLLHIIASPRGERSRTLNVSQVFLNTLARSAWSIETLDLFATRLPSFDGEKVDGKYLLMQGKDLAGSVKEAWRPIESFIQQFLAADAYLLSVPMWNFGIPYVMKQYLDLIMQPRRLFQYTAKGPEGLVKNKKAVIVTSRGGDYSLEATKAFDQQEPYLRTALGFVGLTDITFVHAQPMDAQGPDVAAQKIAEAQKKAEALAKGF